jgi:hypothetical protein
MIDEEEAELRKEQLRLQNAALAAQLHERARAEHRANAAKQIATEAGKVGLEIAKWAMIITVVGVVLVGLCLAYSFHQDGLAAEKQHRRDLDFALEECRRGRVVVRSPDGELGSIEPYDVDKLPYGATKKSCSEVMAGELP